MRLVVLVLLAGCWRSVDYIALQPGHFTTDPLNTPEDLRGIDLDLDLDHDRGEIRDGATSYRFTLTRYRDHDSWSGGCGTHTSYAKLEVADLSPDTFQLRGRTFSMKHVVAECAHWTAVRVWTADWSDRLIFGRP
jgi:hypothetical protein